MKSCVLSMLAALPMAAAELDHTAVAAWDRYVNAAQIRAEQRLQPGRSFLWIDESPQYLAKLQAGEVVVVPVGAHNPQQLPPGLKGMTHDWIGAVFIPNASLSDVLAVVRDYPRYKEYFPLNVLDSKSVTLSEAADRSQMVLKSQSFFVRSALDADYESRYFPVDTHRLYSITRTTRIQEVEGYGSPDAHLLREGEGTGAIWQLFNITRYAERDGGVYVEMEAMALSRDIPAAMRWAVEPVVRRVSRNALAMALTQTETAVSKRLEASRPKASLMGGH